MRKGPVSLEHASYAAKKISRKASGVVQVRHLGPGQFGVFVVDPPKYPHGPVGALIAQFRKGEQA
jgi:hypothetical protein